jgi:GAF domain-containing protein
VIRERREVMYDPAVVDALLRISDEIECERTQTAESLGVADPGGQPRRASPMVQPIDPAITIMTVNMAGQLGEIVGRHRNAGTICEALHEQLSMHMPGLTMVLYQYDPHLDALFARVASGVHKAAVQDLTIGVGSRLTGWVAAHRTTIVNSEAALDLGNMANQLRPLPQRCLSTPLTANGQLAGVLTIYSTLDRAFTPNDTAIFEMLAALLGPVLAAGAAPVRQPVGVASRSFIASR